MPSHNPKGNRLQARTLPASPGGTDKSESTKMPSVSSKEKLRQILHDWEIPAEPSLEGIIVELDRRYPKRSRAPRGVTMMARRKFQADRMWLVRELFLATPPEGRGRLIASQGRGSLARNS